MHNKLSSHSLSPEQAQLAKRVHRALRAWHEDLQQEHLLGNLRLVQQAQKTYNNWHKAANAVLEDAVKQLREDYTSLLVSHFFQGESVLALAHRSHISESAYHRKQEQAIDALTLVIDQREQTERQRCHVLLESRLEAPTYTTLFGVDPRLDELAKLLHPTTSVALVAVTGLGGMGKTALADALLRRLIAQEVWEEIGWVTARQTVLNSGGGLGEVKQPALTTEALVNTLYQQLFSVNLHGAGLPPEKALANLEQHLHNLPHLIVIDNLETVIDLDSLLPLLRRLANPTKFLLTTRHNLFVETIAHLPVPELTETDALHLVRHEAQLRHLQDVVGASDADLRPIYATVGGNPLALRLVVGQLHIHALDTILADLRNVRGATNAHLYTFIYERAWQSLNEPEKSTLLALLMAHQPLTSLEMLVNDSQLTQTEVQQALVKLVTLNLVESRGGMHGRAYSLHGLTRTFLHEVLQWQ